MAVPLTVPVRSALPSCPTYFPVSFSPSCLKVMVGVPPPWSVSTVNSHSPVTLLLWAPTCAEPRRAAAASRPMVRRKVFLDVFICIPSGTRGSYQNQGAYSAEGASGADGAYGARIAAVQEEKLMRRIGLAVAIVLFACTEGTLGTQGTSGTLK